MPANWLRRVWYLLRREQVASDLDEEMRLHRELRAERLRSNGMEARDADLEARRRFGNVSHMTEESRATWGFARLDQLLQDLRFAARRLRQRPAFSVPVIAIVAIGIGATTAVFSAVDAAMVRPLPFPEARRLVTLPEVNVPFAPEMSEREGGRSPDLLDVAEMRDVFAATGAYAAGGLNLEDPERPQRVNVGVVSTGFFATLGVRALDGRTFSVEEGAPTGPGAVILSHALWQRQFGARAMIGTSVVLNARRYTVVGIMPPGFTFPQESDLWIPMPVPTTFATFEPFRGWLPSSVIARVHRDVTGEATTARMLALWQQAISPASGELRQNLEENLRDARARGIAVPLQRELVGNRRRALLVLLGATGLLLLIACANVANLLLSDAAVRRREIAVRGVLGATRPRIVRQLLAESLMLAVAGTVLGVLLAPAVLKVLRALLPATLAGVAPALVDLRVLGFAAFLATATSLLFGLWPAVGATREDASKAIKSGGGHGATMGGLGRVRRVLVGAEVALTVMLLVAAGLMLRSFTRLLAEDTGIEPEQVATLEMSFARGAAEGEKRRVLAGVIEQLSRQPGIVAAAAVNDLPLRSGGGLSVTMHVPDAPPLPEGERRFARQLFATGDYFRAMGIPIIHGRSFAPGDVDAGRFVIINETAAKSWWPGRNPLGRTFSYRANAPPLTVVGVVGDVRERGMDYDPTEQIYQPLTTPPNLAIVARGNLAPPALMSRLSEAVRVVAPHQPVYNIRMMEQVIGASLTLRRTNTILITLFAALAMVLAALGVYSVVAYGVAQRTREFGIRAVLGATGRDIVGLISREMAGVIALGLLAGLASAWALSRVLASLLYEVDPRDPATFVAVPLVLLVPAIIATLVPASRAVRVNPAEVVRTD
ncbi:MAG: ADOP family duplicated permease [Gemmatimonadaceae bacterium]